MASIAIVTGNIDIIAVCQSVLSRKSFKDITLIRCDAHSSQEETIQAVARSGATVVISRGQRAATIASQLPVHVLELPGAGLNLLTALQKASSFGRTIGLIGSPAMCHGAETLADILGLKVYKYIANSNDDIIGVINLMKEKKVDAVVGGYSLLQQIDCYDIPTSIVGIDEESIVLAIEHARSVASDLYQTRKQQELLQSVVSTSHDGLLAVDRNSVIFLFNTAAQRILRISEDQALGRRVDDICKEFSLEHVLSTGENEYDLVITYRDKKYLCNKLAIKINDSVVGGVIAIQNISSRRANEYEEKNRILKSGHVADIVFDDIIGESAALHEAISIAKQFAVTDSSILILGESGTGKELFAQSIHNYSFRQHGPFMAINCAALPPELLESELFGYEAGAFTGARSGGKPGLMELAHNGTLFLDEIGEISLSVQGKLLRALQERKFMRVGGERVYRVNVRLITATNKNLLESIKSGTFRQDLYYRLNVLRLVLPPLCNRLKDIKLLIEYHIKQLYADKAKKIIFTDDAIQMLKEYSWPGNVRELFNIIERLCVLYGAQGRIGKQAVKKVLLDEQMMNIDADEEQNKTELDKIQHALSLAQGNYSQAARILGISRVTLWRKLKSMIR